MQRSGGTSACDDCEWPAEPFVHPDDERSGEQGSGEDCCGASDEVECVIDGGEVVGEDFGEGCDAEHQQSGPTGEPEEIVGELEEAQLRCGGGNKDGDEDAKTGGGAERNSRDDPDDCGRVLWWGHVGHGVLDVGGERNPSEVRKRSVSARVFP